MGYGVQQPQTSGDESTGKGSSSVEPNNAPQPMGKNGAQTNSATSGQPTMGAPNKYSNTVGQWDNTQQQTQQSFQGKGKGA